jgi:hypothetical protein
MSVTDNLIKLAMKSWFVDEREMDVLLATGGRPRSR